MNKLLLILILGLGTFSSQAQYSFNKRETLHSYTTVLTSVVERNNKYYCTGISWDSINYVSPGLAYPIDGCRFAVFDSQGNIIRDTMYQEQHLDIDPWANGLFALDDGSFVVAAQSTDDTAFKYRNVILHFDSLGHLLDKKMFPQPICTNFDWFKVRDFKPTGTGEWLMLSVLACHVTAANTPANFVLTKLDSNFNVIWNKEYGNPNLNDLPNKILVESDGYLLAGGRSNDNLVNKNFYYEAELIKTDTAGIEQWEWISSPNQLTNAITDVIRNQDGGYIYCGSGDGFEILDANQQGSTPTFRGWIEKLDINRNVVWSKHYNNYYYTTNFKKIFQTPSGNLLVFGDKYDPVIYDSTHGDIHTKGWFMVLDANGDSLRERSYKYLYTCSDFNSINDVKQTTDGGFIMVGESRDDCIGLIEPHQRGWLVKVDSNGCLFNDPQCWPTAVNEAPKNTAECKVYPNPAHDYVQVETTLRDAVMELTDITGRSLLRQELSASSRIDLSGFSAGMYLYRIFSNGVIQSQGKVVKE